MTAGAGLIAGDRAADGGGLSIERLSRAGYGHSLIDLAEFQLHIQ